MSQLQASATGIYTRTMKAVDGIRLSESVQLKDLKNELGNGYWQFLAKAYEIQMAFISSYTSRGVLTQDSKDAANAQISGLLKARGISDAIADNYAHTLVEKMAERSMKPANQAARLESKKLKTASSPLEPASQGWCI